MIKRRTQFGWLLLATLPILTALQGVGVAAEPARASLQEIDQALYEVSSQVRVLDAVQPSGIEAQRADFLAGRIRNPVMRYEAPLGYDPAALAEGIRALKIDRTGVGVFLDNFRKRLLLQLDLVENRGTPKVPQLTVQMNGRPSPRLLARAEAILRALPAGDQAETSQAKANQVTRAYFVEHLRDELAAYGLADWQVEVMNREGSTHVNASARAVRVAGRLEVAASVPPRLAVHEVGVHVLRAANGYRQPFRIFATGTAGYQDTEEGLAVYCEVASGLAQASVLRKYAGRALAADAMLRGLEFRETFDLLRSWDIDTDIAWQTTVRAYRGGGYVKDHIYLDGLFRVLDYLEAGGDLATLFVGKIRVADVPQVVEMLRNGELQPAKYLPRRLQEPPADGGAMLKLLRGL